LRVVASTVRVLLVGLLIGSAACVPAWTRAEFIAAELVAAVDRVADVSVATGFRVDQAMQASRATREIAESLARPFPDATRIAVALGVLDAAFAGLSGSAALRVHVQHADAVLLRLRVELVRRWHRLPVRLLPRSV
jgi:hypothetical protein